MRTAQKIAAALTTLESVLIVVNFRRVNPHWKDSDVAEIVEQVMDADPCVALCEDMKTTAAAVKFQANGLGIAAITLAMLHDRRPSLDEVARLLLRAGMISAMPSYMTA